MPLPWLICVIYYKTSTTRKALAYAHTLVERAVNLTAMVWLVATKRTVESELFAVSTTSACFDFLETDAVKSILDFIHTFYLLK